MASQQLAGTGHLGGSVGHLAQEMMAGQNALYGRDGMGAYSGFGQSMQQQFAANYYGMNMYQQQQSMQQLEQLQQQGSLSGASADDKLKQLQVFMYLYQ